MSGGATTAWKPVRCARFGLERGSTVNRIVSFSAASKEYQSGHYVRSLETLNALLETQQEPKTYALLARTLQQLGMKGDAAQAYAVAAEKAGQNGAEFTRKAALLHFEAGNETEALHLGLRYMLHTKLDAEIAYVLASIYRKQGRDDLLSPFCKVLAESSNIEHTRLAVLLLRNNPSDQSQAFLARNLFKRFPKAIQFRLLFLMFSRDVCDLHAVRLNKPVIDDMVAKGDFDFLEHESEFYNLQWCANEELNRKAWSYNDPLQPGHAEARRAQPHEWSEKIRIGYLSSDLFEQHATMKLMGRVLELHDRERFEVTLYCHTKTANVERNTVDRNRWGRVVRIDASSNDEAAALMREDGIDILIDLKGPTLDTRYQIMNKSVAPIQMSWLGYPGSTANTDLDYIIGDKFVLPEQAKPHYHEKFVHLPETYQPNDPVNRPAPRQVSRAQFDLPDDKFVFASFNAGRKITPETVDVWCNILKRCPDSVIWILAASKFAEANLREYFAHRGLPTKRVVFCPHADYHTHIDRQQLADLALDTWPYNGHTTTSEQIWGGLPVLTLKGSNFASRVSESLLNAIGLQELVATDVQGYEDMAVDLYNKRDRIAALKQTIENNRLMSPLFDAERFCQHLETAYEMAVSRAKQGLEPDHLDVAARPARTVPISRVAKT
jgi:tetratricopeptide (TPR) repeat protein